MLIPTIQSVLLLELAFTPAFTHTLQIIFFGQNGMKTQFLKIPKL